MYRPSKPWDRVVDDEPFKDRLQRIPKPMVDKVCVHVKEMLEAGVIYSRVHGVTLLY